VIDEKKSPSLKVEEEQNTYCPKTYTVEDMKIICDPQGSQSSRLREYPLDEYEEYIEVEGDDNDNAGIVYIHTTRQLPTRSCQESRHSSVVMVASTTIWEH